MEEKKYILFTDLKDFTYKNTLLTNSQVEDILHNFDEIISQASIKYHITLIKSIGDAYLAVSDSLEDSYNFAQDILKTSLEYDATCKIDLKKISLRVTITYGIISKHMSLNLEDYFGEAINLGSRIMDMTPAGKIFCTQQVEKNFGDSISREYLGKFSFHGILYQVPLYSLTPISQEEILKLQQTEDSVFQECENIVFRASCVAAILSIQPIPFLENMNVLAVHFYMIIRIAHKFGLELDMKESSKIFMELITPLGLSYIALQGTGTLIKILLPGFGGILFAPISFGVSYALGKIYIMYFYYKNSGETLTPELIKELFKKHKAEGIQIAKKEKDTILDIGKSYSKEVFHIRDKKEFQKIQQETLQMLKKK